MVQQKCRWWWKETATCWQRALWANILQFDKGMGGFGKGEVLRNALTATLKASQIALLQIEAFHHLKPYGSLTA